ncbi:MAG: cytochrome P460 family protein [Acidobacteriota bacterium]|nr:cytochrome P460 family protein [Acidobacteriota bacterium]
MQRKERNMIVGTGLAAIVAASITAADAQTTEEDGPRYQNETTLVRPDDYREWQFLSSGLGMTYEAEVPDFAGAESRPQRFQNVFVNRSSYGSFVETGAWPDGTIFVLEIRAAATEASINRAGRFQTELVALEAEVKDSRFPDGWAFFDFGRAGALSEVSEPLTGERVARCVECHTDHTAVERTFVQFYPTLLEVAREKGTLRPGFD